MPTAFSRLPPRLQEAIVSRLGWTSLRPVQEAAGHTLLDGCNALILAPTAGGKTEAAFFPLLARLVEEEPRGVGLLYVAPIKALLNNQAERLATYTEMVGLRRFLWHGDVSASERARFMREPAEVLMTTPESLEVSLLSPRVPHRRLFGDLRAVVVDEIHALAGTERGSHLLSVLERIFRHTENDVQRIGLSATVGNPAEILSWLQGTSHRRAVVVDPPKERAPRDLGVRLCASLSAVADQVAELAQGQKSLFFCQSRAVTEATADRLRAADIDVFVHHSSVSLDERRAAEERFHRGRNAVIVCTSTLELGIDVGDLDRVFQADAPSTVSSFLQRMGRTGRREGQRANTMFLCQDAEVVLQAAAIVELAREGWVEPVRISRRAWPVLVHQLLAMTLELGAVSAGRCWEQLSRVPDFSGISEAEFGRVVEHMLKMGYLFEAGGMLSMGDRAERAFGRKNYMDMYSVFSTPELYAVTTEGGRPLGSLEQGFVDKLVEDTSSFLLGGRAWLVTGVNHRERTLRVVPAPRGKKPSWGSYVPQLLGHEICRKMADILTSDVALHYLDPSARDAIEAMRGDLGAILRGKRYAVRGDSKELVVWTFAGGAVNQTLKYGLQVLHRWRASSDNFKLKLPADEVRGEDVRGALNDLGRPDFWGPDTWRRVLSVLPDYRLSKFQEALPHAQAAEMVAEYLLDVTRTCRFLSGQPMESSAGGGRES